MQAMTVWLMVALAMPGVGAPAGLKPSGEERRAQELREEIEVRRTLERLRLSDAQKWAMLPALRAQVQDEAAVREAQARAQPSVEPAMKQLRAAVLANQGVSDEIKRGVRDAEAPYKKLKNELEANEPARIQELWRQLTTLQAMALRSKRVPERDRQFQQLARRVVDAPDQQAALAELYRRQGLRGEEIERAISFGRQTLLGARKPSPELGRKLLALPANGILNPRPEPKTAKAIRKLLLSETALRVLDPGSPPTFQYAAPAALESATTDIQVMNLVNTLYLSGDQSKRLSAVGREAHSELQAIAAKRQELARRELPVLAQVRDALARGQKPAPELQTQLKELGKARRELMATQRSVLIAQRERVRALLNPNQLEMIASFVPCTVPVQSLTNPERVGQVADNGGIERKLAKLRLAQAAKLDRQLARLRKQVEEKHRHKKRSDKEIALVVEDVDRVVAEARALDDAQFEVRKHELAERLAVPAKRAEGEELDKRLVRYLLSPNLGPLLASRPSGR